MTHFHNFHVNMKFIEEINLIKKLWPIIQKKSDKWNKGPTISFERKARSILGWTKAQKGPIIQFWGKPGPFNPAY